MRTSQVGDISARGADFLWKLGSSWARRVQITEKRRASSRQSKNTGFSCKSLQESKGHLAAMLGVDSDTRAFPKSPHLLLRHPLPPLVLLLLLTCKYIFAHLESATHTCSNITRGSWIICSFQWHWWHLRPAEPSVTDGTSHPASAAAAVSEKQWCHLMSQTETEGRKYIHTFEAQAQGRGWKMMLLERKNHSAWRILNNIRSDPCRAIPPRPPPPHSFPITTV